MWTIVAALAADSNSKNGAGLRLQEMKTKQSGRTSLLAKFSTLIIIYTEQRFALPNGRHLRALVARTRP
jgi:hypothetical protein